MNPLRRLPSVEQLRQMAPLSDLPHETAVRAARAVLTTVRKSVTTLDAAVPALEALAQRAFDWATTEESPQMRRAVNATGVILHTNLGRATLAPAAVRAAQAVAAHHANLETDEENGGRGDRFAPVAALLRKLTGVEDAFVVNNNAAATILAVAAIATGREVILSRGQMVEIGGQFRLPDVIVQAGAKLVEVGTTNRTRIADYERAITPNTGMILRCHTSNYRVVGFTEETSLGELRELGTRVGVCVGDDIGSGALADFAPFGFGEEPSVRESVRAGADVIWFSGDKLLGGPQSGILLGTSKYITPMKKHPLARALRPDKITLAALEATLQIYARGREWVEIPTLRRIARSESDIRAACERLQSQIVDVPALNLEIVPAQSEMGGGSLPGQTLPSWAVAVCHERLGSVDLARKLRQFPVSVYGRIEKDRVLLDLRAVDETEESDIEMALRGV